MKYFLDECIPPVLAKMLQLLDLPVVHLNDEFGKGVDDVDWLPEVGKREWVAVTGDQEINRRRVEKEVLKRHRVTTFFLYKGFTKLRRLPQISYMTRHWESIVAAAERARPGDLFLVNHNGKLKPYD